MLDRARNQARWLVAGVLAVSSTAVAAPETVGPFTVMATPVAAELLSGGGAGFTWLNVANVPVTVEQALTGPGIVDDGYANAQSGTTLRLTFAPGTLRNGPGPDLVLFDANDDLNVYLVATSHDGFAQQRVVTATTDTGVDRLYFAGGQGPSRFDVFAATIDLTTFGVPDGVAVSQIRLFCEGPSNDPLGLGVLARPGRVAQLRVGKVPGSPALSVDWTASCSGGATGYGIYEGSLGAWYDHVAIDCNDDGSDTVETIRSAAGDRYFLVVPWSRAAEGSYGTTATGAERPPGTSTCAAVQDRSACP